MSYTPPSQPDRIEEAKKRMDFDEDRYGEPTTLEYLRAYRQGEIGEIHIEAVIEALLTAARAEGYDECLEDHGVVFKGQKIEDTVAYKKGRADWVREMVAKLPKEKKGEAKFGTIIKTCKHGFVDAENLYKCQVYGFNTAIREVHTILQGGEDE